MRTGWKATCQVTVWESDQVTQKEERTAAETVPWASEIVRRKTQSSLFSVCISILLLVFISLQPTSSPPSPVVFFLPISLFLFSSPSSSINSSSSCPSSSCPPLQQQHFPPQTPSFILTRPHSPIHRHSLSPFPSSITACASFATLVPRSHQPTLSG